MINKDLVLFEVCLLMLKVIKTEYSIWKHVYLSTYRLAWTLLTIATYLQLGYTKPNKFFDTRVRSQAPSSQWESQKNRFAFISFGKIQFLPPCIWNLPFMSYRLRQIY